MKLVKLGMVCGALLLAACGGEDGATGATGPAGPAGPAGTGDGGGASVESINGITPARAFPSRTIRMTISGDNTNWTTAPAVTFDDAAITVSSVTVASPTALVLDVEIGANAAIGEKTITAGGQTFKGFQVQYAATGTLTGTQAQGSIVFYDVANNDTENLFDTTQDQDGAYVRFGAQPAGDGISVAPSSVSAQSASFQILIDVGATAGETDLTLQSGLTEATFSSAEKLNVAARAPVALATGSNALSLTSGSTALFSIPVATGTKGNLFQLTSDPNLLVINLTDTGSWSDWDTNTSYAGGFLKAADGSPKVIVANFGAAPSSAPLTVVNLPLSARVEAEPNDTNGAATTLADLNEGIYGELTAGTDVDTYKVVLAAPAKLRAITLGLKTKVIDSIFGPQTVSSDTVITILDNLGDTVIESSDAGYGEDVTTEEALPAGTYFVKVTHSSESTFSADTNDYGLFLIATP